MVVNRHSLAGVRAFGARADLFRHDSVYGSGAGESLAAAAIRRKRIDKDGMDRGHHHPVFLGDVWRLFRRGQRNSDVGGDGFAWAS